MSILFAALLLLQAPPATGSITGTVILAGSQTQAPLATARVELSGGPIASLVARTDGMGRFAFANLPAGSYRLLVTKDSYLRQDFAKRAAIVIKPGEDHKPLVVALELAPTIAGRIQNEYGEPIANILVQGLKGIYGPDGKRTFTPFVATLSDDLGEYRLYWLDPGEYIVSASYVPAVKTPANPVEVVPQAVYAPTFYPNASDIANAQRINLKVDQKELTRDFRLIRVAALTVRGSTTTKANNRVPKVNVTLSMAGDSTGAARYATKSNDDGLFEFKNVAPGSYIATTETRIGAERYFAEKHLVIFDHDENNLGLVLSPGIAVQGRIALDTNSTAGLGSVRPQLISGDAFLESYTAAGPQSDGLFGFRGVQPGIYSLAFTGIPEDLYIKSERSGTASFMDNAFGLGWDAPAPLEILLGSDGGHVKGSVTEKDAKPFAGAKVVLVPDATRRDRPDQYRVSTSDEDGNFDLRGIPPGEYHLFAWDNVEERVWLSPEFISKYLDLGRAVTVTASSSATIHIPLLPGKP